MKESEKRTIRIPVMVNEQEKAEIDAKRKERGYKDVSSYARASMMGGQGGIPPKNKCMIMGTLQQLFDKNKGNAGVESDVRKIYRLLKEVR